MNIQVFSDQGIIFGLVLVTGVVLGVMWSWVRIQREKRVRKHMHTIGQRARGDVWSAAKMPHLPHSQPECIVTDISNQSKDIFHLSPEVVSEYITTL